MIIKVNKEKTARQKFTVAKQTNHIRIESGKERKEYDVKILKSRIENIKEYMRKLYRKKRQKKVNDQ